VVEFRFNATPSLIAVAPSARTDANPLSRGTRKCCETPGWESPNSARILTSGVLLETCYGRYVPTEVVYMSTMSAREFNRDVSAAKRAADRGPLVVTDRGEPAYVLLSIAEYRALKDKRSLVERLSMDDDIDIEFERSPEPIDPGRIPAF
jgi:prevent-host-death family protein